VEYFKETGNGQIYFGWAKLEDPGQPPVAVINGPARAVVGETVYFTARSSSVADGSHLVSFNWDFGDGTTASGVDVSHVYTGPGVFNVSLTVVDDKNLSDTTSEEIEIIEVPSTPGPDQPPVAVIVAPSKARVGDVVTFDASYSVCGNLCVSYAWDLGDGTTANAVKLQHVYLSPAVYNVILTVTDDKGLQGTTNVQIDIRGAKPTEEPPVPTEEPPVPTEEPPVPTEEPPVPTEEPPVPTEEPPVPTEEPPPPTEEPPVPTEEPPQPSAVITYEPAQPVAGEPIQFSCEGSDPGEGSRIAKCFWDFGDGGTSEEKNPAHVYDAGGAYTVTMTARNSQGVDDTTTTQVTVTGE
jgi:PKD repeat protein